MAAAVDACHSAAAAAVVALTDRAEPAAVPKHRQTEYDETSRQRLPTDRMMHIAQNSGKNFLKIAIPSCQDANTNNSEEEAIVTYESFVASNHQNIWCFVRKHAYIFWSWNECINSDLFVPKWYSIYHSDRI